MAVRESAETHIIGQDGQENKPIKEGFVEDDREDNSRSVLIKDKTVVFDEDIEDGTVNEESPIRKSTYRRGYSQFFKAH